MGRRLGHHLSTLVEAGSERMADLAHGLQVEHQRPADGGLDCRGRIGSGHRLLPLLLASWCNGNGGGRAQVILEAEAGTRGRKGNRKHAASKEEITMYSVVAA